jgi:hypothetical protein
MNVIVSWWDGNIQITIALIEFSRAKSATLIACFASFQVCTTKKMSRVTRKHPKGVQTFTADCPSSKSIDCPSNETVGPSRSLEDATPHERKSNLTAAFGMCYFQSLDIGHRTASKRQTPLQAHCDHFDHSTFKNRDQQR